MTGAADGKPNPFSLLAAAARGDLEAQRALAHGAMRRFYDSNGNALPHECLSVSTGAALIEGLAFARMAASHGDDSDRNRLIAMLSLGRFLPVECSGPIEAELLARASMWTEQNALSGSDAEGADLMLNLFSAKAPPQAVASAPIYRNLIIQSEAA